jgi:hypothetical protein
MEAVFLVYQWDTLLEAFSTKEKAKAYTLEQNLLGQFGFDITEVGVN